MKTVFIIPFLLVSLILTSCKTLKTTPETISKIAQKIESKNFTIQVNYADPLRMRQRYLSSDYDLKIKNDSAFAYLPYFGVAYVAPYNSSEGGIKFSKPMTDYSIHSNKKGDGWLIQFKIKTESSNLDFYVDVFNNGSSKITVNSYERDPITFTGDIVMN